MTTLTVNQRSERKRGSKMSKNRIVLFGVLGVVVGLVLGVFGRDFIVASEKQEFEAQKA